MILGYIELIWIIIYSLFLSLIYSAALLLIISLIAKVSNANLLLGLKFNKKIFWLTLAFFIFIGLIFYRFSYWRNNGLGETVQVPIGYNQHVLCSDMEMVYFYPDLTDDSKNIHIGNYEIRNNKLCAKVTHQYTDSPKYNYIVYDLETQKSMTFNTVTEYDHYAQLSSLPMPDEFKNFTYHYTKFTAKPEWKRWLLP